MLQNVDKKMRTEEIFITTKSEPRKALLSRQRFRLFQQFNPSTHINQLTKSLFSLSLKSLFPSSSSRTLKLPSTLSIPLPLPFFYTRVSTRTYACISICMYVYVYKCREIYTYTNLYM